MNARPEVLGGAPHGIRVEDRKVFACAECEAPDGDHLVPVCQHCRSDVFVELMAQYGKRTIFVCHHCGTTLTVRHADEHLPI